MQLCRVKLSHSNKQRFGCKQPQRVIRCCALHPQDSSATSVPLPGAVWLYRPSPENLFKVYGDNFVIRKHEASKSSLGLAKVEACSLPALQAREIGGIVPAPVLPERTFDWDAEYSVLPSNTETSHAGSGCFQLAVVPQETMLNTVLQTAAGKSEDGPASMIFETTSSSPRRTSKVKFTCDICGATNIKPVNPFAWTEGTVFAKCGNCQVTHKLVDNLKLFHELAGPVFPGTRKLNIEIPADLPNPLDPTSQRF